jgi:hypothetical protein
MFVTGRMSGPLVNKHDLGQVTHPASVELIDRFPKTITIAVAAAGRLRLKRA